MSRRKRRPSRSPAAASETDRAAPEARRGHRRAGRALALFAALAIAVLLAYQPAWHGGELWDDDGHITRPELQSADGLRRIWLEVGATQQYYPVVHSAFWLFHRLWGRDTLGYHLVNIVLHALSAFLVTVLLRRLAVPGALLAGVLFALHPVHVESVAWITELKNTLSGVLYLGAALAYLRFDDTRSRGPYAIASGLFALALLAKSVTATLPAALLVVFWWRRGRLDRRRDVLPLAPFFAAAVAAGLTTAWVERAFIGARGAEFEFSIVERFLIAGRAIWFYATTLAWPVNLQFIYPRWNVSQAVWWQYLFPIAAAGMLALAWRFRTRSRTPLAVLLLFAGTLSPALGFVNVYPFRFSFVADHFQYLASIPMLAGIAAGLTAMGRRLIATRRAAAAAGVVAIAAVLGTLTWRHSRQYADAETLYRGTIARNPAAWMAYNNLAMLKLGGLPSQPAEAAALLQESLRVYADNPEAHNNLGVAFQRLGRLADAEAEHREALRLFPNYAGAYNNLGIVAEQQGRFAEAVRYYTTALELQTRAGSQAETHHNLGSVLQKLGRFDEAIAQIETALRINPQYADARDNLGTALTRVGRIDDAIAQYREAIRLRPGFAEAHNNLGTALARAGRLDEAVVEFKETIRIKPDAAVTFVNLADAERRQQRPDDAIASLQTAIGLQPALAFAHYSLGNLLHDKGQVDAAIRAYLKALEHEPEATAYAIYNDLGVALAQSGRRQEAIAAFDRALKIKPDFEDARANRARIR